MTDANPACVAVYNAVFPLKARGKIATGLLLNAGADKNASDSWSRARLHDAAEHGYEAS